MIIAETGAETATGRMRTGADPVPPPRSLEDVFGDPSQEGPLSHAAVLAADDAQELVVGAEHLLHEWGVNAEFVPARLGGRWTSTRAMVDRLMPIFRRDPALGLGFGVTSLMSAVHVDLAGNEAQRREVADQLLAGRPVAMGFYEMAHGNDLPGNTCRLDPAPGGGYVLRGVKEVISNLDRAARVVVLARTSDENGPRSHSLVLWDPSSATGDAGYRPHPRFHTSGMRGVGLGGADLDEVPVPGDAVLGTPGTAIETALRAFQVTRSVIPALSVGALDGMLHLALDHAAERRLYSTTVLDLPLSSRMLGVAHANLLLADALASAAVRALHVAPDDGFMLAAACKHLVPDLLADGLDELATLFGSTFYGRVAPYGVLEKTIRDLAVLPIAHGGRMTCVMAIVPLLPRWAKRPVAEPRQELLDDSAVEGEPDLRRLALTGGGGDGLTPVLTDPDVHAALTSASPRAARLLAAHATRLRELRTTVRGIPRTAFTARADAATANLAHEVTVLMAAAAAAGSWYAAQDTIAAGAGTSAADAGLLELALHRSAALLGLAGPDLDGRLRDLSVGTLRDRHARSLSMRHTAEALFGHGGRSPRGG